MYGLYGVRRTALIPNALGAAPPAPAVAPPPVPPVLFVDQATIDRARAAATALNDGNKKTTLPEVVPGFKANSLDIRKFRSYYYYYFILFCSRRCDLLSPSLRLGVKLPRLKAFSHVG
jgi:hypothetical protein